MNSKTNNTGSDDIVAHPPTQGDHAQGEWDRDARFAELETALEAALERARQGGADASAVSASQQVGLSAQVRLGEVETLEHTRDRGLNVTVYIGQRKGNASSADLRSESVIDCVNHALDIARFTQDDPHNGLPEPDWMATQFPDLDLWHPGEMDATAAIEKALICEAAGREDPLITNSEGGAASAALGLSVIGNSLGFRGRSSGTRFSQSCVLIAGEGDAMQRDYWFDSRRCADDLEPLEETGRKAARRTVSRLNSRQLKTCRVPVLFAPEVARSLLGHLVGAISGSQLYRNASFLKDCLGDALFPEWVTISESPRIPRADASAAFDAEGVKTRDRNLVESGVLVEYVLGSYSARRLGMESTGNAGGIHNLLVSSSDRTPESLMQEMGSGLLVTEVIGQGVSLVTGDYSRGAAGFWVENGQIAYPVEEITIAGNLREMYSRLVATGNDVDTRGNIRCGSILVEELTVAGS